jgi:hypothetical protein
MDRDEALRLLRGRTEGIADWNRRRLAGEEVPDLRGADLRGGHLRGVHLIEADLGGADLGGADLEGAKCQWTIFADVNLSEVKGLDQIEHWGPSHVSTDTLFRSRGKIPEVSCGVAVCRTP